jgi:hypothetical protein
VAGLTFHLDFSTKEFPVERKRIAWLMLLSGVFILVLAARNGARAEFSAAHTSSMMTGETAPPVGIFEGHADIGTVLHPGTADYDAAKGSYTLTASGENVWFAKDAYQFAWKKMSGDLTLTAYISFVGTSAAEHRKAMLMVRQSLDADSPYADVTLHGNGMPALQTRDEKDALTHEIQAVTWSPKRLRIEKRGAYFTMWLAYEDGIFRLVAGSPRLEFKEPFYVGIGLCSHDKDVVEKAVFTNVDLKTAAFTTLLQRLSTACLK